MYSKFESKLKERAKNINSCKKASLVVIGSGIKFISHLTTEAKAYINQSNVLLYLVNEPAMKDWIKKNNPFAESLETFYYKYSLRLHCYQRMTEYILEKLYKYQHVCVVLYGHPTIIAKPALDAVIQAKKAGFDTKILPGISAEDCLFADLLINPGTGGCQSYETTDFLIHRRHVEPSSHLILWQVGIIGALGYPIKHDNSVGAKLLTNYLYQFYASSHPIVLYEAAQYPHFEPNITNLELSQLPEAHFSTNLTLYVPPSCRIPYDGDMLKALNINITDLQE